jgi:hypothetical protein
LILTDVMQGKILKGKIVHEDASIYKFSEAKIRRTEVAIALICLCLMQIVPIITLTLVKSKTWKLIIVGTLIVLVSLLNLAFPTAARATNFGAVAAYAYNSKYPLHSADYGIGIPLLLWYSSVRAARKTYCIGLGQFVGSRISDRSINASCMSGSHLSREPSRYFLMAKWMREGK